MFSPVNAPVMDMGNIYIWIAYGSIAGIYSFLVAVFVEAKIAENFFRIEKKERIKISFFANAISAALGIVLVIIELKIIKNEFFIVGTTEWLLAFFLTIAVEFIIWVTQLKATKQALLKVLWFCFLGNLASYAIIILLTPLAVWLIEVIMFIFFK